MTVEAETAVTQLHAVGRQGRPAPPDAGGGGKGSPTRVRGSC